MSVSRVIVLVLVGLVLFTVAMVALFAIGAAVYTPVHS
jgi:hypothetical protein